MWFWSQCRSWCLDTRPTTLVREIASRPAFSKSGRGWWHLQVGNGTKVAYPCNLAHIESMQILHQTTCPNVCTPMLDGKSEFWRNGRASTANNSQITHENVNWGQPSQWRSQEALYHKCVGNCPAGSVFVAEVRVYGAAVCGSVYTTAKAAKICCLSFIYMWMMPGVPESANFWKWAPE